jgi:hypothetical protein
MTRVKSTAQVNKERSQKRSQAGFTRAAPATGKRPRGRRGESLASPRDRQRLRERNLAERERVEGMLADVPVVVERRTHRREPISLYAQPRLWAVQPDGCPVCSDERVVTDEVMHGGRLRMSECLHCEHRWTQRPKGHWVELGATMNRARRPRALSTFAGDSVASTVPAGPRASDKDALHA